MYVRPSTSSRTGPRPRARTRGSGRSRRRMLLLTPPGRTRWALRRYSEDFPDRLIADVPPWVWRQALRERNTRSQNFECIVPPGAAHRQGITGTTVLPAHFPLEVSV